MSVTPTARIWTRGQDLLALTFATGTPAAGTGIVTWGTQHYLTDRGSGAGVPATITPAGSGTAITLSGTAIAGSADYLRIAGQYTLDQIMALDATQENFTEIMQGSSVSIGEIMKQTGNLLPIAFWTSGAPYIQIMAVIGNTVNYRWYLFTMTRESLNEGVTNFGKNTIELTMKPADLGYPSIQYGEV